MQIEETFVTAELTTRPDAEARRPIRQGDVAPRTTAHRTETTAAAHITRARSSNLIARTGRAIVGDGRYKPQPFPRLNNN